MKREDQRELLSNFFNQVRDALLKRSDDWPEEWDGHELRELASRAMQYERSWLLQDGRCKRARDFNNEFLTRNLY